MSTSLTSRKEKKAQPEADLRSLLTPDRKPSASTVASTRKKSYKPSKVSVTSQDSSYIDSNFLLDEAHVKIDQLTTEVERLNGITYELERENETLRSTERFKVRQTELENKVAFLLAENQRLSRLVERSGTDPSSPNRNSPLFMNIPNELYPNADEIASLETMRRRVSEPVNVEGGNIQELAEENELLKTRLNEALDYALRLVDENTKLREAGRESESIQEFVSDQEYISEEDQKVKYTKIDSKQLQVLKEQVEELVEELKKTYDERENFENRFLIKETECENLKKRITELENILHNSPTLEDIENLERKIQEARTQNNLLKNELKDVNTALEASNKLNEAISQLESENFNLNENLNIKAQENEALGSTIAQLNQDNDKLQEELQKKAEEASKAIEELKNYKESVPGGEKFQALENSLKRVSILAAQKQLENDQIRPKLEEAEEKVKEIPELQKKIKTLEAELSKVKGQLDITAVDLDIAKRKIEKLEPEVQAFEKLKPQIQELSNENERIGNIVEQKRAELEAKINKITDLEKDINAANDKISSQNVEIDSLGKIIEGKNKEIETYKIAVNHLNAALSESIEMRANCMETKREYERMKQMTQEAADQMETLRMKLEEHHYLQATIVTNVGNQLKEINTK